MLKFVLFFVGAILISFVGFMSYHLGAFKGVTITEETRPVIKMVYANHTGPYHKTVTAIEKVEKWATENSIDCTTSFGEYLEDPQTVEEARLKSRGGCVVDLEPAQLPEGYLYQEIPPRSYVVAVFDGSPGIGPIKVYPRVADYMSSHKLKQVGSVIELYEIHSRTDIRSMTTTYLFPVEAAAP